MLGTRNIRLAGTPNVSRYFWLVSPMLRNALNCPSTTGRTADFTRRIAGRVPTCSELSEIISAGTPRRRHHAIARSIVFWV